METLYLVQKPNYKKGYYSLKRLCKSEGIDYDKLPESAKNGEIGFGVGPIVVSILEVDTRVKI